jgi:hypothetical protein
MKRWMQKSSSTHEVFRLNRMHDRKNGGISHATKKLIKLASVCTGQEAF